MVPEGTSVSAVVSQTPQHISISLSQLIKNNGIKYGNAGRAL